MPKIFVLRNRLQEQQARLLESQKGQQIKIRSDELSTDYDGLQDQPVALIVDRKSDITAAVAAISLSASTSDKDNCPQRSQAGKMRSINVFIDFTPHWKTVHSSGTTRMIPLLLVSNPTTTFFFCYFSHMFL